MNTFRIYFTLALLAGLTACGGGGGGGSSPTPTPDPNPPTVRTVDRLASGFSFISTNNTNGYVAMLNQSIYVADSTTVSVFSTAGALTSSTVVSDVRGLASDGTHMYDAANPLVGGTPNIYVFPDTTTPKVSSSPTYNFGSLAVLGTDLYAVDYQGSGQVLKFTNKIGNGTAMDTTKLSGPSYISSDGTSIYVTKTNGDFGVFGSNGVVTLSTSTGLTNPKGVAVADGYAYVVSGADTNGNGAVIKRIKLADGTIDTYVDGVSLGVWDSGISKGFCGPTGMVADTVNKYLYVINGYCSGAGAVINNRATLLRIKI